MPSFDVVSEIDQHELVNAIDQANREISNRFDFKGTNSKVELSEQTLLVISKSEFQVKQINDILKNKINKRGIDIRCLEYGEITENNNEARESITIKKGINKEKARLIVKIINHESLCIVVEYQILLLSILKLHFASHRVFSPTLVLVHLVLKPVI